MIIDTNEVILDGNRYRLARPLKRTVATPFPQKITIGDHDRDDNIMLSSWVLGNFHGGLGILRATMPRDADRFFFSTVETKHEKQITLAPEVVHRSDIGPADTIIEFNERLYLTVGPSVYRWSEDSQDLTEVQTLSGDARDIAAYDGMLHIITEQGMDRYNPMNGQWERFTDADGVALVVWDDKLFRLTRQNELYWTIDPSDRWEEAGRVPLPPGYCRQLVVWFDQTGEPVIHAITKRGVWGYEFETHTFHPTPLMYPVHPNAGGGADVHESELNVPVGSSVYRYTGNTWLNVGPDKDEGLPANLQGEVTQVLSGHGLMYCIVNARRSTSGLYPDDEHYPLQTGQVRNDTFFESGVDSQGAILVTPGTSWHVLAVEEVAGTRMGRAVIANVEGTYRLWYTSGRGLFSIDLPTVLHNPLHNPSTRYQKTGFLDTPWFDSGWADVPKLAMELTVTTRRTSETERVRVYVVYDNEEQWELVGTITRPGDVTFPLSHHNRGRRFKTMRVRIELERGDDPTKTPVVERVVVGYLRRPKRIWAYDIEISTAESYKNRTPAQMNAELDAISETEYAVPFTYRGDPREDRWVVVTRCISTGPAGSDERSRWFLTVVDPTGRD